ncbi:MAG: rhodanese-like domain-containing protein [Alphaproteobacteria bacterium]
MNPNDQITVDELATLMNSDEAFVLLDVRTPGELDVAKIHPYVNIPLQNLEDNLDQLSKNDKIRTLCHHGVRSLNAMAILRSHGYSDVKSVHGGIDAWSLTIDTSVKRY